MARKRTKSFGDQIRAAVENCDKTRYRIAQETGIDASSLCRFVKGQVGLSLDALDRLAECIGLQVVVAEKKQTRQRKGR